MVEYVTVKFKDGELSGSGPRAGKRNPTLFCAYRFRSNESKRFRDELEHRLLDTDSLRDVSVVDGKKVLIGEQWSPGIRDILRRARVVIADITALSPEVLFEVGFAHGLERPTLPVVQHHNWLSRLPRWLTDFQIGNFSSDEGWNDIINTIDLAINGPGLTKLPRKFPPPGPGQAVWLPGPPWHEQNREKLASIANRYEMPEPEMSIIKDDLIERADEVIDTIAKSTLLIAPLDNSSSDTLVHYSCGLVVARPKAGVSSRKLSRRVLLVVDPNSEPDFILSEGARRPTYVHVTTVDKLNNELIKYGKMYDKWRQSFGAIT